MILRDLSTTKLVGTICALDQLSSLFILSLHGPAYSFQSSTDRSHWWWLVSDGSDAGLTLPPVISGTLPGTIPASLYAVSPNALSAAREGHMLTVQHTGSVWFNIVMVLQDASYNQQITDFRITTFKLGR